LLLVPVAWLGVKLGLVIQGKIGNELFVKIIFVLLFIIGAKLLFDGLT
jgi:uncharacterized membrane protein YfcA